MTTFTPRPTVYKGVQMRSRLEASWAQQFDAWGWGWEYEPGAFASEEGQYLPDFKLEVPVWDFVAKVDWQPTFVEVKHAGWSPPDRSRWDLWEQQARIIRATHPSAAFVIATTDNEYGVADPQAVIPNPEAHGPMPVHVVGCPDHGPVRLAVLNLPPCRCGQATSGRVTWVPSLRVTDSFLNLLDERDREEQEAED